MRPSHIFTHIKKKVIKKRRRMTVIYDRNERARDAANYRSPCCCLLSNIRRHCSVCVLSCLLCRDIPTYTRWLFQLFLSSVCIRMTCTSENIDHMVHARSWGLIMYMYGHFIRCTLELLNARVELKPSTLFVSMGK